MADDMSLLLEFRRQLAQALAGPPQRRFRVAAGKRVHQPFQILAQGGIGVNGALAPGTRPTDPLRWQPVGCVRGLQFGLATPR